MFKLLLIICNVLILLLVIFFFLFPFVRVVGDSMYPTLTDGEFIQCRRIFFKKKCKVNKIYVIHLRDEEGKPYYVIKRLSKRLSNNEYWFLGDNSKVSYDSRDYGALPYYKVVAVVIDKKVK